MTHRLQRIAGVLLSVALVSAASASAQSKKAAKKGAPPPPEPAAQGAPPKVQVSVGTIFDRRTTRDFPGPELSITFKLEGEDVAAIQSARARVTKATDDTGRDLLVTSGGPQREPASWDEAGEAGVPTPKVDLASPSRKAKTLTALEGVVEAYLPSRDPAGTVTIESVLAKADKPLTLPALVAHGIKLQVLSKAGLENEKKQAEVKKKADAAKKKKGKKGADGLEEMAEAIGDALTNMFERLFMSAGDNDLILKVDDPGKKIFSFGLVAPDGSPIQTYGTTNIEGYRIVRILEPIPKTASLQVRLKTPKSFGELPFALANVKLP